MLEGIAKLVIHLRTHIDQCRHFSKIFTDGCCMIHMRKHTGDKPYKCFLCNEAFSCGSYLLIHLGKHSGEKPYKCIQCIKCFSMNSLLVNHLRIHAGEKPHQCSHCEKGFTCAQDSYFGASDHTYWG